MIMIAIVDYGMGNLLSVRNAVEALGADAVIAKDPRAIRNAERIILPGVGAFGDCMRNLRASGLVEALEERVLDDKVPFLGICLGMQAMAGRGHEGGVHEGLEWIDGEVVRIETTDAKLRVPHVGWNEVTARDGSVLFAGIPRLPAFYFVHSYHMRPADASVIEATCDHGGQMVAAIRKDNLFATQFHPEKSQDHGLRLLDNFLSWRP
jgi:glutamine amidotransferase